jgi:hypothetical protein
VVYGGARIPSCGAASRHDGRSPRADCPMACMSPALVTLIMMALGVDKWQSAPAFAPAIAAVVSADPPPEGYSDVEGAAMLVVSLAEEGHFCLGNCLRGDAGSSVCTAQVMVRGDTQAAESRRLELEASPLACARAAYATIRAGVTVCPEAPLAPYCGGCDNATARSMGERRWRRAEWVLAE